MHRRQASEPHQGVRGRSARRMVKRDASKRRAVTAVVIATRLIDETGEPPRVGVALDLLVPCRPVVLSKPRSEASQFLRLQCFHGLLDFLNGHTSSVPQTPSQSAG